MVAPNETLKGKGKGKGKAREDGEGPVARPGETTPKPGPRPSPSGSGSPASANGRVTAFCKCVTGPVKLPHPKQVAILAACVSMLAVSRSLLIPSPTAKRPAVLSREQEDILVPLVLAQELGSIMERVERDNSDLEGLLASQASALEEVKGFEESLKASTLEIKELEALSRTVQEGYTVDAGLTTQVARAQDNLRDMHRAISTTLEESKQQLQEQMESMTTIRSDVAAVSQRTNGVREAAGMTSDERVEADVMEMLEDLEEAQGEVKSQLDSTRRSFLSASELEALLSETAHTSQARDHRRDTKVSSTPDHARRIARVTVKQALRERLVVDDQAGQVEGCVTKEDLYREVEASIGKLVADGTGLRDFANAAIGGRVIRLRGMTSNTYTPNSSWAPSWYWHYLGVENGIGPVESVISDDSSLGGCWAMEGSDGHVTIELASAISVEGVSIEHVSRLVTLDSHSAPARFEVLGLEIETDDAPVRLGGGVYELQGKPIQTFPLKSHEGKFKYVQFRILSNWGNPDYTCIYRLRVHGQAT